MPNRTALVTGASSGIGEKLARLLARGDHDLVLVARSARKLESLAHELAAAHKVSTHVIAADLAQPAAARTVFERVSELGVAIDVLVNNAGFGSNGSFLDLDLATDVQMIEVNISSLVQLSHLFGRGMRERRLGRILNIASTAGFQPGPYMATYYATKAFVISFSQALAYEFRDSGVSVTCYCPGATATAFADRAGSGGSKLFQRSGVATVDAVAEHAYRSMMTGKKLAVHGVMNRLGAATVGLFPASMVLAIAASLNLPASAAENLPQQKG